MTNTPPAFNPPLTPEQITENEAMSRTWNSVAARANSFEQSGMNRSATPGAGRPANEDRPMKYASPSLTGSLLDAAVAKAEGRAWRIDPEQGWCVSTREPREFNRRAGDFDTLWQPSSEWTDGGPIIERAQISLRPSFSSEPGSEWIANCARPSDPKGSCPNIRGATPLIAAMRAYVASRLDYEVELP